MTPSSRSPAQFRGQTTADDPAGDGPAATPSPTPPGSSSVGSDSSGVATLRSSSERLRLLSLAAVLSVLLSYVVMALVAGLAGLTAGAGFSFRALLVAAIPLWLAAHQVPLVVSGAPLGVLPLVPTAAVLALSALVAARVTRRLGGRLREDASAVVATLAGAHASVAVLATALPQSPVQAAPWAALLGGGLVAATGAGLGALRCTGLPPWWHTAPVWVRGGLAAARIGAAALATEGALMLLSALLVSIGEVYARVQSASPNLGAGAGITLLSLCYLPNALVASVSWVAGPGLSIGAAAASPLFTAPGLMPPIPLMAAMPALQPPAWTVVVFLLPVLAGVLVGRRCREVDAEPVHRLAAAGVAAVTVAVGFALLAAVVSGRLAAGPFDPVDLPALALAGALLGWIGVPAVAVVLLLGRIRRPRLPKPGRRTRSSRRMGRGALRTGAVAAGAAGAGTLAGAAASEDSEYAGSDYEADETWSESESEYEESEYAEAGNDESEYDESEYDDAGYDDSEDTESEREDAEHVEHAAGEDSDVDSEDPDSAEYGSETEPEVAPAPESSDVVENIDEAEQVDEVARPKPTTRADSGVRTSSGADAPAKDDDSDLDEFEFDELDLDEFELGTFDSQLAAAESDASEAGWRRASTDVERADHDAGTADQGVAGSDEEAGRGDAMVEATEPEIEESAGRPARWWRRRRS
ncbi:MAG TPA: DUF6350 family protein [Pseudonocardia sp.]|nr:DUF6350 family protein [Pseudonocardia sp.]